MDNNPRLQQQQQLARKLLVILLTGLVSVLLLGALLYIDDKRVSIDISTLMGEKVFIVLLLAGVCLVSLKLFRPGQSLQQYYRAGVNQVRKKFVSVNARLNELLFAVLTMALLLLTQAGGLDARQLFFMALLSAFCGLLLARVWEGLTARKTEA
ncbi:MAG: hypothetical protein RIB78_05515 [Gammaproteobacteria bacterium]